MTVEYIGIPRGLYDIVTCIIAAGLFGGSRRYSIRTPRHLWQSKKCYWRLTTLINEAISPQKQNLGLEYLCVNTLLFFIAETLARFGQLDLWHFWL